MNKPKIQNHTGPPPPGAARNRWASCASKQGLYYQTEQAGRVVHVKPFIKVSLSCLLGLYFQAHFGCHDILILGKSSIKWRQHPIIIIALALDMTNRKKNRQY